jgi:hypothetical protein
LKKVNFTTRFLDSNKLIGKRQQKLKGKVHYICLHKNLKLVVSKVPKKKKHKKVGKIFEQL